MQKTAILTLILTQIYFLTMSARRMNFSDWSISHWFKVLFLYKKLNFFDDVNSNQILKLNG